MTSMNHAYLDRGNLHAQTLEHGFALLGTVTHESLLTRAYFVVTIETRYGYKVACLEKIACNEGWLNNTSLLRIRSELQKNSFGQYTLSLLEA